MADNLGFLVKDLYWIRQHTKPIEAGSKPDVYLRSRAINLTRFPRDLREDKDGNMVAIIRDRDGRGISWHRTCLNESNECTFRYVAKLEIPKGSSIQLGTAGKIMGAAEGIEDALSASILSGRNGDERIPVWSTIDAGKMKNFDPPLGTERYYIFANNDQTGRDAAEESARNSWAYETRVMVPPTMGSDWNDILKDMAKNDLSGKRKDLVQKTMAETNAKVLKRNEQNNVGLCL